MTNPSPLPVAQTSRRRRSDYRGPRRPLRTRVPVDLADRLEHDAAAAGLPVSEHLAALLARVVDDREAPAIAS